MTDTKACKKTEKQVPPPLKKLKLHVIAFAFFFCFFFDDPQTLYTTISFPGSWFS